MSITISGPPGSGLLASGATVGATAQAQVFTTGVGVGASPPAAMLGVIGADSLNTSFASNISGATGTGLVVTNAGNVGIGTTAPTDKLDVSGGVKIGAGYASVGTAPANGLLVQGNVGIGTTAPSKALDIYGNTNGLFDFRVKNASTGVNAQSRVTFESSGTSLFEIGILGSGNTQLYNANNAGFIWNENAADMIFGTNNAEKIRIQSGGNVGIGTTSPGTKLSVSGGLGVGSTYATTAVSDGNLIISGNVGIGTTSPTAALHLPASSTARASLRIPAGTAPTIPNAGDIWVAGTVLKFYDGTTTKELAFV